MASIVLIESDKLLARNLANFLKGRGYDVVWEVDPQAAMDDADHHPPDLVILDMVLAGRSGAEFLYEFRSYSDWQYLPAIIYSNLPYEELSSTIDSMEHLSISAYHQKSSTSFTQLASTIDQILVSA